MYKCLKCGNVNEFEEINVIKTYICQNSENDIDSEDEFFYRENVICLNCNSPMDDGMVIEVED